VKQLFKLKLEEWEDEEDWDEEDEDWDEEDEDWEDEDW
jgi:hypothetical protein